MKLRQLKNNKIFLATIILILNFALKSSNIGLFMAFDIINIYLLIVLTGNFSNADMVIGLVLLILADIPVFTVVGLDAMVFFGIYTLLAFIERISPRLIKSSPFSGTLLFFILYYLIRLFILHNSDIGAVILNLLLLLVFELVFRQSINSRHEIR